MDFDLQLTSGTIRARRFGDPDARLIVCLPGLSANLASFDFIAERIVDPRMQVISVDLRGRGLSEVTPPGSYGWESHAQDAFAIADAARGGHLLPHRAVDGRSRRDASRGFRRGPDRAGRPPRHLRRAGPGQCRGHQCFGQSAWPGGALSGGVHRRGEGDGADRSVVGVLGSLLAYELEPVEGGVRSRSNRDAVLEDSAYGETHTTYPLWPALAMPVLLLRARREILAGLGRIVSEPMPPASRARCQRQPQSRSTPTTTP